MEEENVLVLLILDGCYGPQLVRVSLSYEASLRIMGSTMQSDHRTVGVCHV
jgi:hypothetical protein